MTLRGHLRSFPPLEVLQFLTNSGKTGTLRVYDESDAKLLAFERGQLLYAVHQRKLPPLTELLVHRGLLSEEDAANHPAIDMRWDDLVSRVLERHRNELKKQQVASVVRPPTKNRLGPVLVTQGRISESQLEAAMDPETIPDKCLKKVLKDAGVLHTLELVDSWSGVRADRSLYSAILDKKILSAEEIRDAVLHISDEALSEILVYQGTLTRTEARLCLDQLESLKQCVFPTIRLGEYMVAKRQITQRQLERALGEQLSSSALLGTILVAQGVITRDELEQSNREIDSLRADFGPMHSFRSMLEESYGVGRDEFVRALREHRESGRVVVQTLAESGRVTVAQMREIIETVLIGELCDLLIWPEAAFEFYEGYSVKDTLVYEEPWFPDDEPFELQPILLNACRDLDELQNQGMRDIFLEQVFVPTTRKGDDPQALSRRDRVLQRVDGRRSLKQVASVLPGNRLSHFQLFADLISAGEIEPLSRRAAFEIGTTCMSRNQYSEALVLFNHALASGGSQPSNYKLRRATQDARLASEKRFLWRAVLRLKQLISPLDTRGTAHRPWMKGRDVASNWLRSKGASVRESIGRVLLRSRMSFENFVMRRAWARNIWAMKVYVSRPMEKLLGRGTARAAVVIGASAALLLIGVTQAMPDDMPDFRMDLPSREDQPVQLRSTMAEHVVDAPMETAPTVNGSQIYLAARDGMLRALQLMPADAERSSPSLELQWSVEVGEYGDILSRPVYADESIFLTNVRGVAHAISPDGETRWQRKLSRLEPMPPTPLYSAESELVGIAVVSRESVYVLDPEEGTVLYRLQTGNRIFARPVGDDELLVVGSGDSHIYMVRWKEDQVVWEHEVSDDITGLIMQDGTPVFATRDGRLAALDSTTGEELWDRTFPRNAIKSLNVLESGEVYIEIGRGTIEVILPRTGRTMSSFSADPTLGVSSASVFEDRYYYSSNSGFMGELNAVGRTRWRTKQPVGDITGWDHGRDFMAVTNRHGELLVYFRRSGVTYGR